MSNAMQSAYLQIKQANIKPSYIILPEHLFVKMVVWDKNRNLVNRLKNHRP